MIDKQVEKSRRLFVLFEWLYRGLKRSSREWPSQSPGEQEGTVKRLTPSKANHDGHSRLLMRFQECIFIFTFYFSSKQVRPHRPLKGVLCQPYQRCRVQSYLEGTPMCAASAYT